MSACNFRLFDHKQVSSYWTGEERAKGVFIAKQAIRNGRDPIAAVQRYMGMDEPNAELCVRRAKAALNMSDRRTVHHVI